MCACRRACSLGDWLTAHGVAAASAGVPAIMRVHDERESGSGDSKGRGSTICRALTVNACERQYARLTCSKRCLLWRNLHVCMPDCIYARHMCTHRVPSYACALVTSLPARPGAAPAYLQATPRLPRVRAWRVGMWLSGSIYVAQRQPTVAQFRCPVSRAARPALPAHPQSHCASLRVLRRDSLSHDSGWYSCPGGSFWCRHVR